MQHTNDRRNNSHKDTDEKSTLNYYYALPHSGGIKRLCASDVCLSRTSGLKSRTERPRKNDIGTEVAHVTLDSDTTFKVKRQKVKDQLARAEAYRGGLPYSLFSQRLGELGIFFI